MYKYKGEYNFKGQVYHFYTHAKDKAKAHKNFLKQLQRALQMSSSYSLRCYFSGQMANFKVEVIKGKE